MEFILIDRKTAKELLDAFGHEWTRHDLRRVERLMGLCYEIQPDYHVGRKSRMHGHVVRSNDEPDVRTSVARIHLVNRRGKLIVGEHDALAIGGSSRRKKAVSRTGNPRRRNVR